MRLVFFVVFLVLIFAQGSYQSFSKANYFGVLASENSAKIKEQINLLKESSFPEKNAYEGALLMKMAEMAATPKEKLKLFKEGRAKLESSIKNDSLNAELRFLRLVIQEHAPKIMNYANEIKGDCEYIQRSYKNLSTPVREAVSDYSKKSKALKIKEN